jgi:hypothetical protein
VSCDKNPPWISRAGGHPAKAPGSTGFRVRTSGKEVWGLSLVESNRLLFELGFFNLSESHQGIPLVEMNLRKQVQGWFQTGGLLVSSERLLLLALPEKRTSQAVKSLGALRIHC